MKNIAKLISENCSLKTIFNGDIVFVTKLNTIMSIRLVNDKLGNEPYYRHYIFIDDDCGWSIEEKYDTEIEAIEFLKTLI